MSNNFRDLIPPPDHPRIAGISERDAYSHVAHAVATRPRVQTLLAERRARINEPFRGITTDGDVVPDLYALADEDAPTAAMVAAARNVLNIAAAEEHAKLRFAIDAPQWRMWSNPELYFDRFGLRLDEQREPMRDAILAVMQASLSPKGYARARGAMLTNAFLGELVNAPRVMNEYSYNFT
ncbi:MAG TPA: DUF3500 domain-containing protein, partial [Acetobacteraceae bacterium]|nr:DUF3500 domain-containing protein [Acetobacteraceae bacterium]